MPSEFGFGRNAAASHRRPRLYVWQQTYRSEGGRQKKRPGAGRAASGPGNTSAWGEESFRARDNATFLPHSVLCAGAHFTKGAADGGWIDYGAKRAYKTETGPETGLPNPGLKLKVFIREGP
jgi:hypothetical protein